MEYYRAIKMSETHIWTNMDSSIKQNVEWKEKSWKIFESMKPFFNIINIQNTHMHTHNKQQIHDSSYFWERSRRIKPGRRWWGISTLPVIFYFLKKH